MDKYRLTCADAHQRGFFPRIVFSFLVIILNSLLQTASNHQQTITKQQLNLTTSYNPFF